MAAYQGREGEAEAQRSAEDFARKQAEEAAWRARGGYVDQSGQRQEYQSGYNDLGALKDPNSNVSRDYAYRGDWEAEARDRGRMRIAADAAGARGAYQADWRDANAAQASQAALMGQLQAASAGDPNSVAQRQLASGYDASAAQQAALAASARGSLAARALAARTAGQATDDLRQRQTADAGALMAGEQMAARGRLAGLTGAVRGQDQTQAFGQAGIEAQQRALNDAAQLGYVQNEMDVNKLGLQGRQGRQEAALGAWNTLTGQEQRNYERAQAKSARNTRMALAGISSAVGGAGQIANAQASGGGGAPAPAKREPEFDWDR